MSVPSYCRTASIIAVISALPVLLLQYAVRRFFCPPK